MVTTLCYIENDRNQYLMLYRNRKANDVNEGKWVGIGGKVESGETYDECIVREVREETGLILTRYAKRGIVHFISQDWSEDMILYTADRFEGEPLKDCNEGELAWIDKDKIDSLSLWEGDMVFLKMLQEDRYNIELTLCYEGDRLVKYY